MNYDNLINIIEKLYNQIKSIETELNDLEFDEIEGTIGLLIEECSKLIISQDLNLHQMNDICKRLKQIFDKPDKTYVNKFYIAGRIVTLYDILSKIILEYNPDNLHDLIEYKDLLIKISRKLNYEEILLAYEGIYDKEKMIEILNKLRSKNLIYIYKLPNSFILKITPIGNDILCFFNEISDLPTYPFKGSKS
jgi:hypothetical protein